MWISWYTGSPGCSNPACWPSVETPRSKPSNAMATFQPSPGAPRCRAASVRAPAKNTSLNSESPVICRIGRIVTPAWRNGTSSITRPW